MKNQEKIDYLKTLFNVTDVVEDGCYFEAPDCCDAYIQFEDFQVGDTPSEICSSSEYYSCCGDILDKDYMMCPTCYEHC